LSKYEEILENIILSTCNRTEIYVLVESFHSGRQSVITFLKHWFHIEEEEFTEYLQLSKDNDAINHTFKLAVGLDSMVLGETQILGQVRDAFLTAQQLHVTGKIFNELFKRVITFAKSAHSNTIIGEQAVSISYVAVELSKKIFGKINENHVVIIGAGEMGELSLENLSSAGVSNITVVNRSFYKAEQLAKRFHATAATMAEIGDEVTTSDIVITSTGANEA